MNMCEHAFIHHKNTHTYACTCTCQVTGKRAAVEIVLTSSWHFWAGSSQHLLAPVRETAWLLGSQVSEHKVKTRLSEKATSSSLVWLPQALPSFLNFWLELDSTLHTAKLAVAKAVRAIVFFLFSTLISSETERPQQLRLSALDLNFLYDLRKEHEAIWRCVLFTNSHMYAIRPAGDYSGVI